jgi:hypothetical protein
LGCFAGKDFVGWHFDAGLLGTRCSLPQAEAHPP